MKVRITSYSSVGHQPFFDGIEFSKLTKASREVFHPDYKNYIPAALIRRMGVLMRMNVAAAKNAMDLTGVAKPDAIVVGTGLGCLEETEKFLNVIAESNQGLLSPTSFIQSTHNTIAGQLSLIFDSHAYNVTHTQGSSSFENSLMDAMLLVKEGYTNVLVGGTDECIPIMNEALEKLDAGPFNLTSGASYFVLTSQAVHESAPIMEQAASFHRKPGESFDWEKIIESSCLSGETVDLLLHNLSGTTEAEAINYFKPIQSARYNYFSGDYLTNSAMALHLGIAYMKESALKNPVRHGRNTATRVVILNNILNNHLGLISVCSE